MEDSALRKNWGSVLFVDLRNFTNLLEFYGAEKLEEVLDEMFVEFRRVVEARGGTVDKLVGDGMLAVFRDDRERDCEANAVKSAGEMRHRRLPDLERRTGLNLQIGIGISTGELRRAEIAEIDETIISRNVNIAARLQSLCKKFDIATLTDRETRENIDGLAQGYRFRMIPDQRIEGIYERIDVFEICPLDAYDEAYLEDYNGAAQAYKDGNYSDALEFFVSAYSDTTHKTDRTLLHHFASECFDRLDSADSLFQNAEQYEQHSNTQRTQADYLLWRLEQFVDKRDLVPARILDVGCGSGALTEEIAENYGTARLVGIDRSAAQIQKAKRDHDHPQVSYEIADIVEYAPEKQFDIVLSNSTMHWIQEQDRAYANIFSRLNAGGILAVHQGGKGCYAELHEAAQRAYEELGLEEYFRDFQFPLVYYKKEEMVRLLENHGFEPLKIDVMESEQTDTLVDDFAEASLLSYKKRLSSEAERQAFVQQYKEYAREYDQIDTTRIYAFAARPGE
jgi:malonyl-CoA O-methyltransferase